MFSGDRRRTFPRTQQATSQEDTKDLSLIRPHGPTNVRIRECLVPRKEIEGIDQWNLTMEEVRQKIRRDPSEQLVVYDGNPSTM